MSTNTFRINFNVYIRTDREPYPPSDAWSLDIEKTDTIKEVTQRFINCITDYIGEELDEMCPVNNYTKMFSNSTNFRDVVRGKMYIFETDSDFTVLEHNFYTGEGENEMESVVDFVSGILSTGVLPSIDLVVDFASQPLL